MSVRPPQTYTVDYPTTGDQERASLIKINDLLYRYIYGSNGLPPGTPPPSLDELIQAVKGEDAVLASSGLWVNAITILNGPCLLWQLDVFSISPALEWVWIFDALSITARAPGQMPVYIAPIYPNMSTSFNVTAPFSNGVTLGMSTFADTYVQETNNYMLVTAVRRGS
jgi:hypothetical protein